MKPDEATRRWIDRQLADAPRVTAKQAERLAKALGVTRT